MAKLLFSDRRRIRFKPDEPRRIRKGKNITTRDKKEIILSFNDNGRKIIRENRGLVNAFRALKDLPLDELIKRAKQGIDLKDANNLTYAKISLIAERTARYSVSPAYILKVALSNGKYFAFKIGSKGESDLRQDIGSSFMAREAGAKTIDYYLQFQVRKSDRYFVLMEYVELPTLDEYEQKLKERIKHEKNPAARDALLEKIRLAQAAWIRGAGKLYTKNIEDVTPDNVFIRETPEGPEAIFFDLALNKHILGHAKHYLQ